MADYEIKINPGVLPYLANHFQSVFIEGKLANFIKSITKGDAERFYDTYDFNFDKLTDQQREALLFCITKLITEDRNENEIREYYTFEDFEVTRNLTGDRVGYLDYDPSEIDFLRQRYGPVPPQLQITLEVVQDTRIPSQAFIENLPISYDTLSSLGEVTQEQLTVSAVTGSATGLITEETETVTDVGGLSGAGRDRAIENTGASVGGGSATTVRTSGY